MDFQSLETRIPKNHINILIVDDDTSVRNIVSELLSDEGYACHLAASAVEALNMLKIIPYDLLISDVKMPNHDGLWLLDQVVRLQFDCAIIMMTGFAHLETAIYALQKGAADYITKPIRSQKLYESIDKALEERRKRKQTEIYQKILETAVAEKTQELSLAYKKISQSYNKTLEALITALDARENETGNHSQRVARYTVLIADHLGLTKDVIENISRGALLHDIGKIGVSDNILLKPGPLTSAEWIDMKRHPEIGFRILEDIDFLRPAADIVLAHQERFDGHGYPNKLKGLEIPLGARVFSIADTYDAITCDRPYRKGRSAEIAYEEILRCSGSQFDPDIVKVFLTIPEEKFTQIK